MSSVLEAKAGESGRVSKIAGGRKGRPGTECNNKRNLISTVLLVKKKKKTNYSLNLGYSSPN